LSSNTTQQLTDLIAKWPKKATSRPAIAHYWENSAVCLARFRHLQLDDRQQRIWRHSSDPYQQTGFHPSTTTGAQQYFAELVSYNRFGPTELADHPLGIGPGFRETQELDVA
jgi:hypothetical protein